MSERAVREVSRHEICENGVYRLHCQIPGRQFANPYRVQPIQCESHVGGNETIRRATMHT